MVISTIHQAKDLEWDCVYIPRLCEGSFHSSKVSTSAELEEERRVFYVSCTRAKRYLTLTYPQEEMGYGGELQTSKRSIFIREVDPSDTLETEIELC